jgi:hypothetical protein
VAPKIYFKRGLKNLQFIEITEAEAEAEAKLSGTGQIQLEMAL